LREEPNQLQVVYRIPIRPTVLPPAAGLATKQLLAGAPREPCNGHQSVHQPLLQQYRPLAAHPACAQWVRCQGQSGLSWASLLDQPLAAFARPVGKTCCRVICQIDRVSALRLADHQPAGSMALRTRVYVRPCIYCAITLSGSDVSSRIREQNSHSPVLSFIPYGAPIFLRRSAFVETSPKVVSECSRRQSQRACDALFAYRMLLTGTAP
jgi:hypothetical protein